MNEYVTIVSIFCASGFGIYGALMEGMSGDSSILLSKSIMDLFAAVLFAGTMGAAVSFTALPQFIEEKSLVLQVWPAEPRIFIDDSP